MTNPCPCELVLNDSPIISTTDASIRSLTDEESQEDSAERVNADPLSKDKYQDLTNLYPFIREAKSLTASRKRFKRPSWASIGRRSAVILRKRPSWAQIG